MPSKLPLIVVTGLFLLRAAIAVVHGNAHDRLSVPLAPWQNAYVWLIITIAPTAVMVLLWFKTRAALAWTLAGLLIASWLFGLYFHFGPSNPDHVSMIPDLPGHDQFTSTALGLAVAEPLVAAAAAWLAWSLQHNEERRNASDHVEQAFLDERPRLFQLAYRLMGTVSDADDALQDVFVRLRTTRPEHVASPSAYLTRAVVRRCLDGWKSARRKREQYVGQWLPEPLADDDRMHRAELAEQVSLAFLVVLESLNPVERAVFLLHDVFQYTFEEIAQMVEKTPAACRQIGSRARAAIAEHRPRFPASRDEQHRLVGQFLTACRTGSLDDLKAVLSEDVVAVSDGGGRTPAARVPIVGFERVTRFLLGLRSKAEHQGGSVVLQPADVNGTPGIIYWHDGRLFAVLSFEFDGGQIHRLYSVLNPDKLASFHTAGNQGG